MQSREFMDPRVIYLPLLGQKMVPLSARVKMIFSLDGQNISLIFLIGLILQNLQEKSYTHIKKIALHWWWNSNQAQSWLSLFNLRRLKPTTKSNYTCIYELRCADDAATTASVHPCLQHLSSVMREAYAHIGMDMSLKNTEVLHYDPDGLDTHLTTLR